MFKNTEIQKVVSLVVILILLGFVIWYILKDLSIIKSKVNTQQEENTDSIVVEDNAEIDEIPVNLNLNADEMLRPKLNRIIIMPERFSSEAVVILENNIKTLISQLNEDPNSYQAWSDLANQYKTIDDFDGAIEIWEYLSISAEGETISKINLGNLYHYELKEFEKSESAFKDALVINKKIIEAYTGLHELYKYSYKQDTTLATDILLEGLEKNPNNIDLLIALASYYKEKANMIDSADKLSTTKAGSFIHNNDRSYWLTNAQKYYTQARDEAQKLGNSQLVELLNKEISK